MSICPNCNAANPANAMRCFNCDVALASPPAPAIAPPVANYSYPGPPQNPPPQNPPPQGFPQVVPQGVPQQSAPPQGIPQGFPQGVPLGFPQGVPQQSTPPTAFPQQAPTPVPPPAPQAAYPQSPTPVVQPVAPPPAPAPQSWQQVYAPPPPPEPPAPPAPPTPTELYELGYNYLMAEGGYPKDTRKAVEYLSQAAGQGVSQAQVELGLIYERGEGVHRDMFKAFSLYSEAAERGDEMGQFFLGVMYEDGKGVEEDKAMAAQWYCLAAEQGCAEAQNNLGVLYLHGSGVPQDNKEAANLFRQAGINGCENAKKNLQVAEEEIRVEQVPVPTDAIRLLRRPCLTEAMMGVFILVAASIIPFLFSGQFEAVVLIAIIAIIVACSLPVVQKKQFSTIDVRTISANYSPKEVLRAVEKLFKHAGWVEAPGEGDINWRLSRLWGSSLGPVVSVTFRTNTDGTHELSVGFGSYETIGNGIPKLAEKAIRMKRSVVAVAESYGDWEVFDNGGRAPV